MPRRDDISSILVLGSGPIVIGQACEFDYSGTQACRALRARGVPGRPGQLQSGDDHDRPGVRRRHLRRAAHSRGGRADPRAGAPGRHPAHRRRPDRHQPGAGAPRARRARRSTASSCSAPASRRCGSARTASSSSRRWRRSACAVCRERLRQLASRRRARSPSELGYPVIVRPSFTLGGEGGGICLQPRRARRDRAPPRSTPARRTGCCIEESVLGWKEFELEVMRDQPRQRHRRLLGGERRRHGRAHRRLDHRARRSRRSPTASTRRCATTPSR